MRRKRTEREDGAPFRHVVKYMISKAQAFQGLVLFSGKRLYCKSPISVLFSMCIRAWKVLGNSEINNAYTLFQ